MLKEEDVNNDYRVRTWRDSAKYHREHGELVAANHAADVADAIRFYLIHLSSSAFKDGIKR